MERLLGRKCIRMNRRVNDSTKKPDVDQMPSQLQTVIAPKGAGSLQQPPKGPMAPADCHLAKNFRTVRLTSNIDKADKGGIYNCASSVNFSPALKPGFCRFLYQESSSNSRPIHLRRHVPQVIRVHKILHDVRNIRNIPPKTATTYFAPPSGHFTMMLVVLRLH